MANVTVNFNNQHYHLACQDGEEDRLGKLADYVEDRAAEIAGSMGAVSDFRLLLMTALSLADELDEGGQPIELKNTRDHVDRMEKTLATALKRIEDITREVEA